VKVTKDVILDLLPLYEAGEASADSRALVESFLAGDAELRQVLERMKAQGGAVQDPAVASSLPNDGHKTEVLRMTKRRLQIQSWLMGLAIFCSLVPLSFSSIRGKTWWMLRDAPQSSAYYALAAVVLWAAYFSVRRRNRVTGL
jgi:hypothetical protein